MNKTLISEVEDSMRRQKRHPADALWEQGRQAFIDMTAWMLIVIENGDKRAADKANTQNESGDSESES